MFMEQIFKQLLKWPKLFFLTAFLVVSSTQAQYIEVVPNPIGDFSNVFSEPYTTSALTGFRMKFSCFGTNLRGTENPLAPDTLITIYVPYKNPSGKYTTMRFTVNSLLMVSVGARTRVEFDIEIPGTSGGWVKIPGAKGSAYANSIRIDLPSGVLMTVPVDGTGAFDKRVAATLIDHREIGLWQAAPTKSWTLAEITAVCPNCNPQYIASFANYLGKEGALSFSLKPSESVDKKLLSYNIAVPGQVGFCNSFFSPIMLFFDEQRPRYTGITSFPLTPFASHVYWPEANAPGYVLALDRDGDNAITVGSELFGDGFLQTDGYKVLAELDLNKDKIIDENDPDFKNLLLWKDKNLNGKSEPSELKKLADLKVKWISIDYRMGPVRVIGKRAKEAHQSNFAFEDKNGKIQKGTAIDVYFAPATDSPKMIQAAVKAKK
jgi:hypothetical protein